MVSRRWGNSGALRRLGLKEEDIAKKMASSSSDLELEVEVDKQRKKTGCFSTTNFELPEELPSVEEALRMLAGALKAACKSGLDKVEVQRLQVVATLALTYNFQFPLLGIFPCTFCRVFTGCFLAEETFFPSHFLG